MAPSAMSFRIGHGAADSALTLQHQRPAPDDSLLTKSSTTEGERTSAGGPDREAPSATPSADAFDAEWDAVIDAATD
jgi:hypothetical protein